VYEDYVQWIVAAYTTKKLALKHAERASLYAEHNPWQYWDLLSNPYDQSGQPIDSSGVKYTVGDCVLRTSLPRVKKAK
jgi:hypothetical protein